MNRRWLMCALLGALAWGQAQPGTPAPAHAMPTPGNSAPKVPAEPDTADSVPLNAAVLTIDGVCAAQPRPSAAKAAADKAAAAKTGATSPKPAVKAASTECKTVITRKEFEQLADSLAPRVTPQLKKQLATAYPGILAFAQAAHKQGLDKGPRFEALMSFYRVQILSNELKREVTEQANKLSDEDIDKYYQEHLPSYQQFTLDRVFIPHFRQPAAEAKPEEKDGKDEKLAPAQQVEKAKADAAQEEEKLSESLRTRAAAGEDFAKLQKEAYDAAGMKMEAPSTILAKVRRNSLPPGQISVFDLKEGEVSPVISDSGGHYIYRVKSIEEMPLEDALKNEIRGMLQGQRQREGLEKYQKSYTVETNEAYFGPPAPAGMPPGAPPMRNLPNRVPRPAPSAANPAAQPQTTPPAQPPAAPPN